MRKPKQSRGSGWGYSWVVEHLLHMREILGSILSTTKNKNRSKDNPVVPQKFTFASDLYAMQMHIIFYKYFSVLLFYIVLSFCIFNSNTHKHRVVFIVSGISYQKCSWAALSSLLKDRTSCCQGGPWTLDCPESYSYRQVPPGLVFFGFL